MKLIVGLGNPGKTYENTKHNIGFIYLDNFCSSNGIKFVEKKDCFLAEEFVDGEKVIFLKPTKFMNLSGEVVRKYYDYYNLKLDDLLIIYDDVDFDLGSFRLKPDGSSGGHNGIKNVIKHLGTSCFPRLRIGISKNKIDLISYVMSKFSDDERKVIESNFGKINEVILDFIRNGLEYSMNKHNSK